MGRAGAGSTTRKRKPFCKPCMQKGERRHPDPVEHWKSGRVKMKCICGHEYYTYSMAAQRLASAILGKPEN